MYFFILRGDVCASLTCLTVINFQKKALFLNFEFLKVFFQFSDFFFMKMLLFIQTLLYVDYKIKNTRKKHFFHSNNSKKWQKTNFSVKKNIYTTYGQASYIYFGRLTKLYTTFNPRLEYFGSSVTHFVGYALKSECEGDFPELRSG